MNHPDTLKERTQDGIRNIGSLTPCDAEGYMVNATSIDYLVPPWQAPVEHIIEACRAYFADRLIALYLRGSLAYGTAMQGISDLDMFAIIQGDLAEHDLRWGAQLNQETTAAFPFLSDTDVDLVPLAKTENRAVRLVLKTQTVFLWGRDLTLAYPKYKISYWAAQHVYLLGQQMGEALTALYRQPLARDIEATCAWICKRMIRAGFELVMEREQAFTRDLYPAFKAFAKYYPEQRERMYAILKYAIFPSRNPAPVIAQIKAIGPWLACEADTRFSRYIEAPDQDKKPAVQRPCAAANQPPKALEPSHILAHNQDQRLVMRFGAHQGTPTLFFRCGSVELGLAPDTLDFLLELQRHSQFRADCAVHWQENLTWTTVKPFLETLMQQGFLRLALPL